MSFNKRVKHDFTPTLLEGREPLEARGYKHSSESFGKDLWFEMSDSGEPHRLEELESKVENMVDMISQLLEAKSAGGGQQREEEESGGTRREADHNYNGGAGRASPTLTQVMVLQQSELQQLRRYPSTAEGQRQNQQDQLTAPAGDQKLQLAWA